MALHYNPYQRIAYCLPIPKFNDPEIKIKLNQTFSY